MPNASVTITATNKVKQGIDPAKKSLLEFQNTVDKIQKNMSKAFNIASIATATVASFRAISKAAKQVISEYSEAEKVFKRLEVVWDNVGKTTGQSYQQIMDYADAMEKQTYFTGEAIEEAALLLAATESLTEEGFQRALDTSMDLAAALGEDVTSAAQTLSKAIQEPESALSRLKTIGVSFTEDEKEQIKALADANKTYEAQSLILDKIEQKYKGVAKAINDTPVGLIDNINDTLGDIRENLGKALVNALSPALRNIYEWLTKISDWMASITDANAISSQIQSGASLSGFSEVQLEAVKRHYETLLKENPRANGRDMTSFLESAIEKIATELANRPKTEVTPDEKEGDNSTTGSDKELVNVLQNFIDANNKIDMDKATEYQTIIATATEYLDKITKAVPTTKEEMISLLGLGSDANGADINKALKSGNYEEGLKSIISIFTQKLDELPTDLENFLSDYGSLSTTKQANEIKSAMDKIAEIYSTASGGEQIMLDEINIALMKQLDALYATGKKVEEVTNGTFLDQLSNSFAGVIESLGFGSDESKTAAGALLGTALEGLGEAGEAAETLATNMATMGPLLGAIVTALQYVIKGLMEVLGEVLGEQIMIVVDSLMEIGRAIGQILLPIIKTLSPVLEALVQPILVFTGALSYAGQALQHWVANLFNNLANWSIGSWHPFGGLRMDDPGSPGKFGAYLANYMNDYNAGTSSADSASTETALSSASYRGATQVTINIYQMSPVVGENGMRQFAQMIREEFDALDYYGVSA